MGEIRKTGSPDEVRGFDDAIYDSPRHLRQRGTWQTGVCPECHTTINVLEPCPFCRVTKDVQLKRRLLEQG